MDDNFRGFETKTLTLVVGQEEQKLYVSRGVLTQIPYFEQALIDNDSTKSCETQFKMPEFDPRALADVIYFFWTKAIPELHAKKEAGELVNKRVKAYIATQKLALDWMQKEIECQLVFYHRENKIDPCNLILLYQANLRDSVLYKFMIAELGYLFAKNSLEKLESFVPGFTAACKMMPQEVLWDFLKATDCGYEFTSEEQPSKQASWLEDIVVEAADAKDESKDIQAQGDKTKA